MLDVEVRGMLMAEKEAEAKTEKQVLAEVLPEQLEFHYIKSNQFRVIHVDGGIGSITPKGFIHFALYSERLAIPRKGGIHLNPLSDFLGPPHYAEPFKNSKEALCKAEIEKKAKEIIHDILKALEKNTGQPIPAVEKEQIIKDYVARQVQLGECGSLINGLV